VVGLPPACEFSKAGQDYDWVAKLAAPVGYLMPPFVEVGSFCTLGPFWRVGQEQVGDFIRRSGPLNRGLCSVAAD
jgi:hypothetical protein